MGNSLAAITFANMAPFSEVGSSMRSVSASIRQASTDLSGISASLNTMNQQAAEAPATLDSVNAQLDTLRVSLSAIEGSVNEAQTTMPTYFAQAKLAVVGVVAALAVFGAVFILTGVGILSMRSYIVKKAKQTPP
jgi:glutamine synthetase type III